MRRVKGDDPIGDEWLPCHPACETLARTIEEHWCAIHAAAQTRVEVERAARAADRVHPSIATCRLAMGVSIDEDP